MQSRWMVSKRSAHFSIWGKKGLVGKRKSGEEEYDGSGGG